MRSTSVRWLVLACVWWIHLSLASADQPQISYRPGETDVAGAIEVSGIDEQAWKEIQSATGPDRDRVLRLYVKEAFDAKRGQSVLAELSIEEKRLRLQPRYPLTRGVDYVVVFEPRPGSPAVRVVHQFKIAKPVMSPEAAVAVIYPTADVLPQNLLKFYLHFTHPMAQGDVYRYIELSTEDGRKLDGPFLEIQEELWDQSGKRLTLLLDPGRVKRGLVPREEDGPILIAGQKYQLTIKSDWPDARGVPMVRGANKRFTVAAEDFKQPDPATWKIIEPKSLTRLPLVFESPEPLDHATFARGVVIRRGDGSDVAGDFRFEQNESRMAFVPAQPWQAGKIDIAISTLIEDLAGNSIGRAFEVDRFDEVDTAKSIIAPSQKRSISIQ